MNIPGKLQYFIKKICDQSETEAHYGTVIDKSLFYKQYFKDIEDELWGMTFVLQKQVFAFSMSSETK